MGSLNTVFPSMTVWTPGEASYSTQMRVYMGSFKVANWGPETQYFPV